MEIFSIIDSTADSTDYIDVAIEILNVILFGIAVVTSIFYIGKILWNKQVKKLNSKKYKGLNELGFHFVNNCYYEGVYREFLIRISPTNIKRKHKRSVLYDVIQAFYQPKPEDNIIRKVEPINYYLGDLFFYNTTVMFIPKDFINPNFKENIDGLINILKREGYKSISKEDLLKLDEIPARADL